MKVLLLNPHLHPEHEVVRGMQAKGYAVLLPGNAQEAWQMLSLHGASLDLAVIHREDAPDRDNDAGFQFISKIKADPLYSDLPVIITTHRWSDAECARHQETPQGANAYLRWPFDAAALGALVQAVFGGQEPVAEEPVPPPAPPAPPIPKKSAPPKAVPPSSKPPGAPSSSSKTKQTRASSPSIPTASGASGSNDFVLEDASNIFSRNDRQEKSDTSIRLEMPDFEAPAAEAAAPEALAVTPEVPDSPSVPTAGDASIALPTGEGEKAFDLSGMTIDPPESEGGRSEAMSLVLAQDSSVEEALDAPSGLVEAPAPSQRQASRQQSVEPEVSDAEAAQDMPYLFQKGPSGPAASVAFALPLGDAVVPGGAAQSPDVETLKKYLLLREQDVAVLSSQLKASKDQVKATEELLRQERGRNSELTHVTGEQKRRIDDFERDKQQAMDTLQSEISELRFQLKAKTDKARILDTQVRDAAEEMERLKERVRSDIRKIRVREKELENRLEIMKKDSEALIAARENKIIELKRKLDLLEFNMDLLQDQHSREKENASKLRERLAKAAQVVRVAGGLLDNPAGASQLAAALAGEDNTPTPSPEAPGSPGSEDAA